MTVTVPLCVRRGCERSIRSVKAKSRNELALEHAILSSIDEHLVKIGHGSRDKTLSHYAGVRDGSKENRAAPATARNDPRMSFGRL